MNATARWKAISGGVLLAGWIFCWACPGIPEEYERLREQMVKQQIAARGIKDLRLLAVMGRVPRHLFVPREYQADSYDDKPLPIGHGQTISQPYIVAYMTEALDLTPDNRVLEIGTGSGYQAAILAELVKEVYSVEIVEPLANQAAALLQSLGYRNVWVKSGDGNKGWPEHAPYDAVIVTCAPEEIPQPLIDQLREGGRLIIPMGTTWGAQNLVLGVKKGGSLETEEVMPVRFVPMVPGDR